MPQDLALELVDLDVGLEVDRKRLDRPREFAVDGGRERTELRDDGGLALEFDGENGAFLSGAKWQY